MISDKALFPLFPLFPFSPTSSSTVVVLLCDEQYAIKAKRTIREVRSRGEWTGDLVLLTVDFVDSDILFHQFYRVRVVPVRHIDTSKLLDLYKQCPLRKTHDDRETAKLFQWDKLYVFHPQFAQWENVIYLDAGLRVVDKIQHLIDCFEPSSAKPPTFFAPDDCALDDPNGVFRRIIEVDRNVAAVNALFREYSPAVLEKRYFMNCMWMYNAATLLKAYPQLFEELVRGMNTFPLTRCNEMTVMNLVLNFKYKCWKPFPTFLSFPPKKRLYVWCESDFENVHWTDCCFIKYSRQLPDSTV
jgi:hypothetical protein